MSVLRQRCCQDEVKGQNRKLAAFRVNAGQVCKRKSSAAILTKCNIEVREKLLILNCISSKRQDVKSSNLVRMHFRLIPTFGQQ